MEGEDEAFWLAEADVLAKLMTAAYCLPLEESNIEWPPVLRAS
jgi:hypothetical protein